MVSQEVEVWFLYNLHLGKDNLQAGKCFVSVRSLVHIFSHNTDSSSHRKLYLSPHLVTEWIFAKVMYYASSVISDGGEITSRDCSPRFSKIATDKSTETRASRERTDNGWCSKKWNKMYGLRARSCTTISSYHWGDDSTCLPQDFPTHSSSSPSRAK